MAHKNRWQQRSTAHKSHGQHAETRAYRSEDNIELVQSFWSRFCREIDADCDHALAELQNTSQIKAFFDWKNEKQAVTVSSNESYLKRFQQLYKDTVGKSMPEDWSKDLRIVKPTKMKAKPTPDALDLVDMLHHQYDQDTSRYPDERQRVQQSLLMMMMAYSALRPSSTTAIRKRRLPSESVGPSRKRRRTLEDSHKTVDETSTEEEESRPFEDAKELEEAKLRYQDFAVIVMQDNGINCVGIQAEYNHFKGNKRRQQKKIFTFWQQPDVRTCPVAHLIALAIHDGAFKNSLLSSADKIVSMRLPLGVSEINLSWSSEGAERAIMRQSLSGEPDQELSNKKAAYRFLKLGKSLGYVNPLHPYCFRRLALNTLDEVTSEAIRNQIAGHTSSRIYEQHYAAAAITHDVANLTLRRPTEERLTSKLNRMATGADRQAYARLSSEEREAVFRSSPELNDLTSRRDQLTLILRSAEEQEELAVFELREERDVCERKIRSLRAVLEKQYRAGYQTRKHEKIVDACLRGETEDKALPAVSTARITPSLPERAELAQLVPAHGPWTEQVGLEWARGVELLVKLCGRVEKGRRPAGDLSSQGDSSVPIDETASGWNVDDGERFPKKCHRFHCLFCMGDENLPDCDRRHQYSSQRRLWEHTETHLQALHTRGVSVFACPHPQCQEDSLILPNEDWLCNHVERVHGIKLKSTVKEHV